MSSAGARRSSEEKQTIWTHPSVLSLAAITGFDPINAVTARARETVFSAIQSGWSGPPYDPFALAEFLKVSVEPRQDVVDARTLPAGGGKFRIEFNPNRSSARINFSVAHEIAHTLFPDCAEAIRNRFTHAEMKPNDWQLEVLCNIGAAEILMPVGSFHFDEASPLSIDTVIALQREFSVSSEAVLLRIAKLTNQQCFMFVAHRDETKNSSAYRLDYTASSRTCPIALATGFQLPSNTVVAQCTAIGFTAKAEEHWISNRGRWRVECLGIAPYPGHLYPRVVGIVMPTDLVATPSVTIKYLKGDATQPRGTAGRMIVQVVNDKAITWGKGFSVAVRKHWPHAQKDFTRWVFENRREFKLGNIHVAKLEESIELVSLVAQHGYGPSLFPRIQYAALESCLSQVAVRAKGMGATVHMPRIGCGEAGGDWNIVSEMIDEALCRESIPVTVYDLPGDLKHLRNSSVGPLAKN
ncbi:MAG: ImmA/IrrE family metallo-endopeptidase [Candidatus Acidiferrales bacterium]